MQSSRVCHLEGKAQGRTAGDAGMSKCSCIIDCFVDAEGSAIVNGREWRWEFHKYLGPTFLRKDGEPMARFPREGHPVWAAFETWLEGYLGHELPHKKAEREQSEAISNGAIVITMKS